MNALATYHALVSRGSRPALTLYGSAAGAPRLELSGTVIANHAAKAANYLADDLMIDQGSPLRLDLPVHWRLLTWGLGGFLAGAHVSFEEGDTIITATPEEANGDEIIAVSLGALDLSWRGELPVGVTDGNAEVLAQADVLLDEFNHEESNADTFTTSIDVQYPRILLVNPDPDTLLRTFMSAMLSGQTLVVVDAATEAQAAATEGATRIN